MGLKQNGKNTNKNHAVQGLKNIHLSWPRQLKFCSKSFVGRAWSVIGLGVAKEPVNLTIGCHYPFGFNIKLYKIYGLISLSPSNSKHGFGVHNFSYFLYPGWPSYISQQE